MKSTQSFSTATRLSLPLVLLFGFTATFAQADAPKHRIKSATVDGSGSIILSNDYEGGSEATFYGDASFMVTTDTGDVVKVVMKNGKFSAFLNDEPIDASRIFTDNNVVRVLDKAGDTLFEAKIPFAHRPESRVMLGVMVSPPDPAIATQLGLKPDAIVITQILPGTPAAKAGLKPYDVLLKVDGKPVTQEKLSQVISSIDAGQEVMLNVLRDGKAQGIIVTMERVPSDVWAPAAPLGEGSNPLFRTAPFPKIDFPNGAFRIDEKQLKAFQERFDSMTKGLQDRQEWDHTDAAKALRDQLEIIRKDATLSEGKRREIMQALMRTLESIKDFNIDIELPAIEFFDNRNDDHGAVVFRDRRLRRGALQGQPNTSSRLDSLEKRLNRIESLLEKLLEREIAPKADKKGT